MIRFLNEELGKFTYSISFPVTADVDVQDGDYSDISSEARERVDDFTKILSENLEKVLNENKSLIEQEVGSKLLSISFVDADAEFYSPDDEDEGWSAFDFTFSDKINTDKLIAVLSSDKFNFKNKKLDITEQSAKEFERWDDKFTSDRGHYTQSYDSDYVNYNVSVFIGTHRKVELIDEELNESNDWN